VVALEKGEMAIFTMLHGVEMWLIFITGDTIVVDKCFIVV
jgi:hypothetical protein